MKGIATAFLILAGVGVATAPVPAFSKSFNEVSGGTGDASAQDECAPGQYLVGVRLRHGAWWDQMQIACAEFLPEGRFGPAQYPRPPRGGNGGGEPTLYRCDENELLTGVVAAFTEGRQVTQAVLHCMSTTTGASRTVLAPRSDRNAVTARRQLCSIGEVGIGFGVRYGRHVNAIGLICDTFHAPTPPPVSSADTPAPRTGEVLRSTGRAAGSAASDRATPVGELLVCRGGGGMTETPLNEGRSVYIHFTPAATVGAPAPGECAWTNRPFGQEGRRLALQLSTANAQLVRDAARGGGTFRLETRPIGSSFIMVSTVINVEVADSMPLSPGPVDATAPAQAEAPPPGGGQQQAASICGLPVGAATVVIGQPGITELNVRDRPAGTAGNSIIGKIPEGTQVNVVGGCGVQLSAGIVTQQGGNPVPGWCGISEPMVGCVAEQFLVAGAPVDTSVGIVANRPQAQPAPRPPVVAVVPPAAQAGALAARLTQGANIRNEPSSRKGKQTVLFSLPAGTLVTVLECQSGWCRLALPQQPVAWVSRDFLAFDVAAAPVAAPSVEVNINIGGAAAPAPAPQPAPVADGSLTASTCGLPGGTATVMIPNPAMTDLNVRDKPLPLGGVVVKKIPRGTQVTVAGGCGVSIAAGIVAGAGTGQPPIPGWCAIISPEIGCVSEEFLVAGVAVDTSVGIAAARSQQPAAPEPATAATFAGTWNASAQGSPYTFQLNQNGNDVTGSYTGGDGSRGQINGNVSGNVLRFSWRQTDGLTGAGKFALSGDGNAFTGSYALGTDPDVAEGSWNGTRQ